MSDGWEPLALDFPWWLKLLVAILATALVVALYGIAVAAPAPFPRCIATGVYNVTWGGERWLVTLAKDGSYACRWGGIEFVGRWRKDADGNLCITERLRANYAKWTSYVVKLNAYGIGTTRDWEGKVVRVEFKRIKL